MGRNVPILTWWTEHVLRFFRSLPLPSLSSPLLSPLVLRTGREEKRQGCGSWPPSWLSLLFIRPAHLLPLVDERSVGQQLWEPHPGLPDDDNVKGRIAPPMFYRFSSSESTTTPPLKTEDVSLNPDHLACKLAEDALASYERDVGFGFASTRISTAVPAGSLTPPNCPATRGNRPGGWSGWQR
ncbi:hypothetical protein FA13DRAFT_1266639 [Coprinellus micaceus]|uniref:Uncharacterized protein n=1 Tax=Coprinellus micaceus TaxID=71717 RepID=A0A4Y7R8N8_COPMI|nr:hypothetical protein FA13DRAFT_1266639 [Coprinellus micaceus]